MSRPGYVFDLDDDTFVCRSCGMSERGKQNLHARMREHLSEHHALQNVNEWKVTQQERGEGAAVCWWPPEAL